MFLFSRLTYFVQLLYLGKLSRPKYQQKLNKIMKISQEDVILIKNLYLSKQYVAQRLLRELSDKGWKLWIIDSLLKRSHKTSTIVPLSGSVKPRLSQWKTLCSVRRTSQKGIGQLVRFRMKLFKLYRKIIHRDLQLTCFKWCRARLLSEANRISRYSALRNGLSFKSGFGGPSRSLRMSRFDRPCMTFY